MLAEPIGRNMIKYEKEHKNVDKALHSMAFDCAHEFK